MPTHVPSERKHDGNTRQDDARHQQAGGNGQRLTAVSGPAVIAQQAEAARQGTKVQVQTPLTAPPRPPPPTLDKRRRGTGSPDHRLAPELTTRQGTKQNGAAPMSKKKYYNSTWVKIRNNHRKQSAQTNAPCWLCGQPIDYTITDINNDDCYEPDHLYPTSTHPQHQHDPANLRPSHRKCNRTRGNKKATGGLGTTSRQW